jgi:hypothetical protein
VCKLSAPEAVIVVAVLVDASRVMEQGEQPHDFEVRPRSLGYSETVFHDTGPMDDAMIASHRKGVFSEDHSHDG